MATLSNAGYELLKGFEGFKLKPYKATKSEKYWTVGLGHYGPDVDPNKIYTEDECKALFAKDKVRFENDVNKVWHNGMTLQMFDALFSIAYNHGNVSSTVLKQACSGEGWRNESKIRSIWQSLYTVGGLLTNRRRREVDFFFGSLDTGGDYSSNTSAYASNSGNYGSTGGYDAGMQNNNFSTYSSSNPGVMLNTNESTSYSLDNKVKHTRIYKICDSSLIVDELSLPINEGSLKDSSTNNKQIN